MTASQLETRNMTDALLSVAEAASLYPLSERRIRELAMQDIITGRRFGRTWVITRASLEAYLALPRRRGRKPKNPS